MNDASHRSTKNFCRMKCSVALALVLPFGLLGCPSRSAGIPEPVADAPTASSASAGGRDRECRTRGF
jgi:hypothetical protein